MSTVRYFRHDDAGAPTLNGTVGSLTNLLRKCLVGVDGIAYGAKASAGWSEAFIGAASNIAVFRNKEADGASGCYCRINDNAPGAGGACDAQLTSYAAMTDINTGTSPTAAPWLRKSQTADSTARKWVVVADGITAWVCVFENGGAIGYGRDCAFMGFGDYACVDSDNAFRYFAMGTDTANSADPIISAMDNTAYQNYIGGYSSIGLSGFPLTGIGSAVNLKIFHAFYQYGSSGSGIGGTNCPASPDPATGDNYFSANPMVGNVSTLMGRLRGLIFPFNNIITNSAGAGFPGLANTVVAKCRGTSGTNNEYGAAFLIDTAGPWP